MLYASTRLPLLRSLGSTLFTDSIFASSKTDLTAESYASHLRHNAAPHPLSAREQEMADLRAAESETATYEGSRGRASHIGAGVGLNWSEEVENSVRELGQGSGSAIVVIVSFAVAHLGR
jgi:twinfilin-like protein